MKRVLYLPKYYYYNNFMPGRYLSSDDNIASTHFVTIHYISVLIRLQWNRRRSPHKNAAPSCTNPYVIIIIIIVFTCGSRYTFIVRVTPFVF